jgi:hypothetical protein
MRNLLVVASGRQMRASGDGRDRWRCRDAEDIKVITQNVDGYLDDLILICNKSTSENVLKRPGKDLPE